jgi:hypothetical protein
LSVRCACRNAQYMLHVHVPIFQTFISRILRTTYMRPADVNSNIRRYISHTVSANFSSFLMRTRFSFFGTSIYFAFDSRLGQDWNCPARFRGPASEYGGLVPRGVKLTEISIQCRVKMGGAISPLPHTSSWCTHGKNLHLHWKCSSSDKGPKKKV